VCVCDGVLHWPQNNKRMIGVNGSQIIQPSSPLGGGELQAIEGINRRSNSKRIVEACWIGRRCTLVNLRSCG
jgi:hypothetical protein